jgi:hypothetical protein
MKKATAQIQQTPPRRRPIHTTLQFAHAPAAFADDTAIIEGIWWHAAEAGILLELGGQVLSLVDEKTGRSKLKDP